MPLLIPQSLCGIVGGEGVSGVLVAVTGLEVDRGLVGMDVGLNGDTYLEVDMAGVMANLRVADIVEMCEAVDNFPVATLAVAKFLDILVHWAKDLVHVGQVQATTSLE